MLMQQEYSDEAVHKIRTDVLQLIQSEYYTLMAVCII